jgi:hypothetical protein
MRLDNDSDEVSAGRLFIHGRLNDPMTGGPLCCRVLSFDAAWVEYEPIYHREVRTGLALYDDLDHMVAVARQANVARPGEIDFPAWTVWRIWCRAGVPDCPHCPLKGVCPKLIDRGAGVKAV